MRSGPNSGSARAVANKQLSVATTTHGDDKVKAQFIEVDGQIREVVGDNGGISFTQQK